MSDSNHEYKLSSSQPDPERFAHYKHLNRIATLGAVVVMAAGALSVHTAFDREDAPAPPPVTTVK